MHDRCADQHCHAGFSFRLSVLLGAAALPAAMSSTKASSPPVSSASSGAEGLTAPASAVADSAPPTAAAVPAAANAGADEPASALHVDGLSSTNVFAFGLNSYSGFSGNEGYAARRHSGAAQH